MDNIWKIFIIQERLKTIINIQYNFNHDILIWKATAPESTVDAAGKKEVTENEVKVNRDTFEYCKAESTQTYSPETISKSFKNTNSVSATSTQDVATTLSEKS